MTPSTGHSVGVRLQLMPVVEQTLVLSRLVTGRQNGVFKPQDVIGLFRDLALPEPTKISNTISALKTRGLIVQTANRGEWKITPIGRKTVAELLTQQDMSAVVAEAADQGVEFASTRHTIVPATLAPPDVVIHVGNFLEQYPFETNVFGMTRFPDSEEESLDPMNSALSAAQVAIENHGMSFHLASDRAMSDDLWVNISSHMWASAYGIAFFENRRGRGMNYNLTIEVGAMMMTGRRCLLLKDTSIEQMPTDLVGRIYKVVDLDSPETVTKAVHEWVKNDLDLGSCNTCLV